MRATGNGGVFCLVSPDRRMRDVEHLMLWKGSASLQAVRAYKHATGRRLWASGFGLWALGFRLRASGFGLRASGFGLRASGFGLRASGSGPQATTMRPARHPLTTYAVPGRENSPVEYFPFGQAAATNNASQAFHVAWYEMEPAQKHATRL
ncbi:hypothetical protein A8L50_04495 [Pantoea ananatis]|nr:hypothetical protein [Pantoea ananatis]NQE82331.1 hypothetical protein [Pantoea ananatis]